jgi:hypothetical protein
MRKTLTEPKIQKDVSSKPTSKTKDEKAFIALKAIYDDEGQMSRNPKILASRANTSQAAATRYLKSLAASQVMAQPIKPNKKLYVPTAGASGLYLADTVFFKDYASQNKQRGAILTIIGINTRYSYSRAIITNPNAKSRGVDSAKTTEAMKSILAENAEDAKLKPFLKITAMKTDNGPENQGTFTKLLEQKGIKHIRLESMTHERLARLDRFHGSLRNLIGQVMAKNNNNVWYIYIGAIIKNYNHSRHDSLSRALFKSTSPASLTAKDELALMKHDYDLTQKIRAEVPKWPQGTKVRLLYSRTNKGGLEKMATKSNNQSFTSEVYEIQERTGPNSYRVNTVGKDPRIWPYHALQVVSAGTIEQPAAKKVNKAVVSAKRMENLNISGPEKRGLALNYKRRQTIKTRSSTEGDTAKKK